MAENILLSISLIIGISALVTIVARFIKQPPIIAYLISGIIVGPLILNLIGPGSSEAIQLFSHIGVAFLLFIVGLSLDLRVLKEVGKVSSFAGLIEIGVTGIIGFLIAIGLGFNNAAALYIGAALAFSSTVVVVKILSDKREIDTLHGRIALGILIVEDFVAALALMVIPLINKSFNFLDIGKGIGIIILLSVFIFFISTYLINRLMNYLARSQEALFLFGVAWALSLSSLFSYLEFSFEIGALIAGMSIASSKYNLDLGSKMKPLRDFFIVLFFVFFGSQLIGPLDLTMVRNAVIFSIFVIIGKPIIVMSILRVFGYKKRTNFLAGSSLAQISEFSLILVLLGFRLGYLNQQVMSLVVMIAIITIGVSSYNIYYSNAIFNKISKLLGIFEGKRYKTNIKENESFDIVLFGYHRTGYKILKRLEKMNVSFMIVDYNPKVILGLSEQRINCVYGDASDKEFLEELNLHKAKLIISTIPDENSNLCIKEHLKRIKSSTAFIATAEEPRDAEILYKSGVDYVLIPHHLGGEYAAHMIERFHVNRDKYREEGRKHFKELKEAKRKSKYV